ncbi:hypothetical protein AQUCO_02900030v1 [Aquilegia coerulea]|uniref:Beta-glucosidase n=1 Tax=Aquilegia coerulea TaxID=218851 RepID=A0A2G5D3W4_AQUCA|nr:hypothetical protein AQUCO_02900030v1 [Aquilegia coerulea]
MENMVMMRRVFSNSSKTVLLLVVFLLSLLTHHHHVFAASIYSRDDFPYQFIFGSGVSAYQAEGAAAEDGRTPCTWDTMAQSGLNGPMGNVTCDQYHKYKEDVQLMVDTGLEAYRFSISWSRLIPNGRGPVNPKGLQYYNNLINELIRYGIEPHALEDEYGGWRSKKILKDFTAFADVCFREFGDRVTYWTTINEANVFALGFDTKTASPSAYPVAHNCLLGHAAVARLYKSKYQVEQHGFIGLNLYSYWYVPLTNATEDVLATQRAFDFAVGWIMDPLTFGDYPEVMKKNAGSRLPSFTPQEAHQVMNSYDFIGLNHYSTMYVKDNPDSLKAHPRNVFKDMAAAVYVVQYPIDPASMQGMLEYFKQKYRNPPIYIHENGQRTPSNSSLNDISRVKYLHGYIGSLLEGLRNGSNARGYFTWSFLDVFELLYGFESRFGLYYVDFNDPDLKRYAKLSAHWYSNFLKGRNNTNNAGTIDADQKNIYTLPQTSHMHTS